MWFMSVNCPEAEPQSLSKCKYAWTTSILRTLIMIYLIRCNDTKFIISFKCYGNKIKYL